MNLTKTNWPLGWTPSADAVNGDPNGLLRMDNLSLDNRGGISLVNGIEIIGQFADYPDDIFSKVIGAKEYFWVGLNVQGTQVFRTDENFGGQVSLAVANAGTNSARACFGDCLGQTIAIAGKMRTKDTVVNPPTALGLLTPLRTNYNPGDIGAGPLVDINSQPSLALAALNNVVEGTAPGSNQLMVDPSSLEGVVVTSSFGSGLDTTLIGPGAASDIGKDIIQLPFRVLDQPTSVIQSVEIDFLLDGNPTDQTSYNNYYNFVFDSSALQSGLNTNTLLSATRNQFNRYGNDPTVNWSTVIGIRVVVLATSLCTIQLGNVKLLGGSSGQLNGVYNYIQIDVTDNGNYLAKSPTSGPAFVGQGGVAGSFIDAPVINGSVTITPLVTNPEATHHWFFRKAASDVGIDPNTGLPLNQSILNDYNFIGKSTIGQTFTDILSDVDVLLLNADGSLLPNRFLQTMRSQDLNNGLQDLILGIEGLFHERMFYVGPSFIYISDALNPDAIDTRYTLKPSGDPSEVNLWLKRVNNNVCILATTKNLYEITGTLNTLPDGTLDVSIIGIGESYPPLSRDCVTAQNGVFYVAADGLRVTTGSNSTLLSPQLRLLFQGTGHFNGYSDRHGVPGVMVDTNDSAKYPITVGHNRIYFTLQMRDGTRRLIIYDLQTQTYSLRYTDPVTLYTTARDEVLAGYNTTNERGFSPGTLCILDPIAGIGVSSDHGLPITFRTVFDANNQPRNRKDTFTLKLIMDTGGLPVSVMIQKDGKGVTDFDEPTWTQLGQFSCNGLTTIYIPLDNVTLGFRYALQIVDTSLLYIFHLYEMTIEYEPRPEQVDYMRILPTNLGTISRKRVTAYAFVIDTLGNDIKFTPYLDNQANGIPVNSTVNTLTKLTYIHYFTAETICTDVGGILSGGVFEFYEVNLPECISEKLPTPCKFLVVPENDYGTPQRKRHTSYKFQINTRGKSVTFAPIVDGVRFGTFTFSTPTKQLVELFFPTSGNPSTNYHSNETDTGDVIGIGIGGEFSGTTPFEFYGVITPERIETLPNRVKYFRIPNENFGVASRKRVRTLPLTIDTYGNDVTYTPIVDGVLQAVTSTFNTNGKMTVFHYFSTDIFGTDYGGILSSTNDAFEFYGMGQPEQVEVLPVGKKYDQLGPLRFDKIGKLFTLRFRLIMTGTTSSLPISLLGDDNVTDSTYGSNPLYSSTIPVRSGIDNVYEIQLPKSINTDVLRVVLGPSSDVFHRYDMQVRVAVSGLETEAKWIPIR